MVGERRLGALRWQVYQREAETTLGQVERGCQEYSPTWYKSGDGGVSWQEESERGNGC